MIDDGLRQPKLALAVIRFDCMTHWQRGGNRRVGFVGDGNGDHGRIGAPTTATYAPTAVWGSNEGAAFGTLFIDAAKLPSR